MARYCPHCDRMVLIDLVGTNSGNIEVCNNCGNALLYDNLGDYLGSQKRSFERMEKCDHDYGEGVFDGVCTLCFLPEEDDPEDVIDSRAVGAARRAH